MFISVEAVRWVFVRSRSERSARLVFLAIAAHCNEDGYAWPGLEAIMRYSALSKPVVLEAIQKLVDLQEMTVEKGGKGAGDTNKYFLSAFMDARVRKGKETADKGKEGVQEGYTRVYPNKTLEQEEAEKSSRVDDLKKSFLSKCQDPHGQIAAIVEIVCGRAERSGVVIKTESYLEKAVESFDTQGGQDREELLLLLHGKGVEA